MQEFIDQVRHFVRKSEAILGTSMSEEATKHALVLPMLQILGYNVFDPMEVVPEYTADVGIKKGEKVDYAILVEGKPAILIEAKPNCDSLENHDAQLYRYFSVTTARFAILTNGIQYKFFSDLQDTNKMDPQPFMELDLRHMKDAHILELRRFHKANFNVDDVSSAASVLRYTTKIIQILDSQLKEPTDEFLRFLLREVHSGVLTQKVLSQFRPVVQKAIAVYINDAINDRLTSALHVSERTSRDKLAQSEQERVEPVTDIEQGQEKAIETTVQELEGYFIIKAILRREICPERVTYKDTLSYFGVLLDGNTWRWVCRLYFGDRKYIVYRLGDERIRRDIEDLNELYQYEDELLQSAREQDVSVRQGVV